jgi:hypothetical protein
LAIPQDKPSSRQAVFTLILGGWTGGINMWVLRYPSLDSVLLLWEQPAHNSVATQQAPALRNKGHNSHTGSERNDHLSRANFPSICAHACYADRSRNSASAGLPDVQPANYQLIGACLRQRSPSSTVIRPSGSGRR